MPIYEYTAKNQEKACTICGPGFEDYSTTLEPLKNCPKCGQPIRRLISAPNIGASKTGFDDRAKSAGFHKLKKTGAGEYEKQY